MPQCVPSLPCRQCRFENTPAQGATRGFGDACTLKETRQGCVSQTQRLWRASRRLGAPRTHRMRAVTGARPRLVSLAGSS